MTNLNAPIIYAVKAEDQELTLARIHAGGDVNFCDERYGYAIIWAVQLGHVKIVEELLKNGADPNAKNNCDYLGIGCTALHLITDYENNCYRGRLDGDEEIRKMLVDAGGICVPESELIEPYEYE